jgi:tRNA(Ile2) C34 agmatinyltransferase TiaS
VADRTKIAFPSHRHLGARLFSAIREIFRHRNLAALENGPSLARHFLFEQIGDRVKTGRGVSMSEGSRDFLIFEGVAWKRAAQGTTEASPYCPNCRVPLELPLGFQHFVCPKCKFGSNLKKYNLETIRQRINLKL